MNGLIYNSDGTVSASQAAASWKANGSEIVSIVRVIKAHD